MKKNLQLSVLALALCCVTVNAQNFKTAGKKPLKSNANTQQNTGKYDFTPAQEGRCATPTPHGEWESWSAEKLAQVEKENKELMNQNGAKTNAVYTIPVIFHIIHNGTIVGNGINISQAQINDQITIINNDYKSAGLNNGLCPAVFAGVKADAQISFCLATKNPTGGILVEPGIDRKAYTSLTSPAVSSPTVGGGYSMGTCDASIKPQTIWNPTYYFNVWVTQLNGGLLGYATFPIGTTITGITGNGSASTDGVVCSYQYIGSIGSASLAGGYNKGRTLVHESGHWLGLRHINGDSNCATDYTNDTPTQDALHGGCIASTGTYHAGICAGTTGEMTMNYMDYTDDACMYMWSTDQKTRMQQAMVQGTYRNQLSASSTTLCSAASPQAPTSSFALATTACTGVAVAASNGSTGNPTPTYSWSSMPSAGVTYNPNSTATNPSITFASAGNYTITCKATNSVGTNSSTKTISVGACTVAAFACGDTLTNFRNTDTIQLYTGGGYVGGNNSYGDKEKAESYSSVGLVGTTKVMGGIVLFYRHATANIGTKGTSSSVAFKMYNGNNTSGPSGAAINTFVNTITSVLAASTATTNFPYIGNPSIGYSTAIIRPYSFNFASPTTVTGDFLLSCTTSTLTGDTIAIFTTGPTLPGSTAWEMWSDNSWNKFNDGTTNSWQLNSSLAILPKTACVTDIYNVNGISGNIAIFPNPSGGVFNFAVTMPKASDLNFTVMNSIGQVVYTKIEKDVTSQVIPMNLSHLAKGIYFVNIIDSTGDKVTKKIIIE